MGTTLCILPLNVYMSPNPLTPFPDITTLYHHVCYTCLHKQLSVFVLETTYICHALNVYKTVYIAMFVIRVTLLTFHIFDITPG